MPRSARSKKDVIQPQSFLDCLRYFLTPQVFKQAHRAFQPHRALRWRPGPLLLVLLTMTWCAGESLEERFETARAFYIASYQRKRRPGETIEGFHKALARLPVRALRAVAAAVRSRLEQVFAQRLLVDGFIPLGCDGSRLECPRTPELQQRLVAKPKEKKATKKPEQPCPNPSEPEQPHKSKRQQPDVPMVFVSAFVHLSTGLLWSWCLGGPYASERDHLLRLLDTLPPLALIVTDAGYASYQLMQRLNQAQPQRWFLMRLSSKAPLYSLERIALSRFCEGIVYYWPAEMQSKNQPPIEVRLLRLRVARKIDVWLITNVLDAKKLSLVTASKFYRWRWRNEGFFRSYKRTLGKVKLLGRTVAQVHREAEGSLLAVQLVLAHGVLALPEEEGERGSVLPSARRVVIEIRAEINIAVGMYLGPRQRQTYLDRIKQAQLKQIKREQSRKKRRKPKVRQRWHRRHDHKPPKAPKIRKMGTDLKDLMAETLGIENAADC